MRVKYLLRVRGADVRRIREELGLDVYAFAATLGVHVSTLYRWEASRRPLKMDPLQAEILERLAADLRNRRAAEKRELGQAIVNGLLVGGAIFGLAALLAHITRKERA